MKITKLECRQLAGVPDGSYSFLAPNRPTPNDLTLIAGVRGAGKTRFLEAIVALKELVGAYRAPPALDTLLETGAKAGTLAGSFLLSDEEKDIAELTSNELSVTFSLGESIGVANKVDRPVRNLFSRYQHDHAQGKLEYFPALRSLPPFGEPTNVEREKALRLASQPGKYAGLIPSLIDMSLADGAQALRETATRGLLMGMDAPDSLVPYRSAFASLIPEVRLRGAQPGKGGQPTLLFERSNGTTVDAHSLSESQKQAVLIAGTMVRIGLSHSIVLLDSPELHIHVADQGRFLQALIALGDDNQWIVATGSSDIMKTARREQMIALPSPSQGAQRG